MHNYPVVGRMNLMFSFEPVCVLNEIENFTGVTCAAILIYLFLKVHKHDQIRDPFQLMCTCPDKETV